MKITWTSKPFADLSLNELYEIMKLRSAIFVVEQDCPYLDADDKDQKSHHFMGTDEDGDLVAYTRLLPKGVSYPEETSIGRVVTSAKVRGKGAGKQLMEASINQIKALFGTTDNRIGAQCYLIKFYESFGYQIAGEEYLEDGIPHIEMVLKFKS